MSEIIIIAAVAKNGVIGSGNQIPWHIKEDFQHFKKVTMGFPVIMGQKTYESLPTKPLPGRINIVVAFEKGLTYPGCIVVNSLDDAFKKASDQEKVFIIGGGSIYAQTIKLADRLEITLIDKEYSGDVKFPEIDPKVWRLEKSEAHVGFAFNTYVRKI